MVALQKHVGIQKKLLLICSAPTGKLTDRANRQAGSPTTIEKLTGSHPPSTARLPSSNKLLIDSQAMASGDANRQKAAGALPAPIPAEIRLNPTS